MISGSRWLHVKKVTVEFGLPASLVMLGSLGLVLAQSSELWGQLIGRVGLGRFGRSQLDGASLGTLERLEGLIRHRANSAFAWIDFDPSEKIRGLQAGDGVFTGSASRAQLNLHEFRVEVDENSLVRVELPPVGTQEGALPVLRVERGKAKVQSTLARRSRIKVINQGREATLELLGKVEVNDSPTLVRALEGEARVIKPEKVSSQSSVMLAPQVLPVAPTALATKPLEIKPPDSKTPASVPMFQWSVSQKLSPPLKVQVSSTAPEQKGATWDPAIQIPLVWSAAPDAVSYEARIFEKGERVPFQVIQASRPSASLRLTRLPASRLEYSVSALGKKGERWLSARAPVSVEFRAPRLTSPRALQRVSEGEVIPLAWTRTKLTEDYEVQISSRSNFSGVLVEKVTKQNLLLYAAEKTGTVYWRVRSRSGKTNSSWSQPRVFKVVGGAG